MDIEQILARLSEINWTTLIPAFIGSAIGVAFLEYWLHLRRERWQQRKGFLEEQLRLYGPVYSLLRQNQDAVERAGKIWDVVQARFESNPRASKAVDQISPVANKHISQIVLKNNEILKQRLSDNLHLLDPDDVEPVTKLLHDLNNYQVEVSESEIGSSALPVEVAVGLPPIHFYRLEVNACIKQGFDRKRAELRRMLAVETAPCWKKLGRWWHTAQPIHK